MVKLTAVTALALLAACTSTSSTRILTGAQAAKTSQTAGVVRQHGPVAQTARQTCQRAFPRAVVLGWQGTSVATLRDYGYGGPTPRHPLAHAFAGTRPAAPGTWCVIRVGPQAEDTYGVVAGDRPVRAIGVRGPGSGRFLGELTDGAPRVP